MFNEKTFRILVVVLLLVILGVVSFNAYTFIVAKNGIKMGAGVGMGVQVPKFLK